MVGMLLIVPVAACMFNTASGLPSGVAPFDPNVARAVAAAMLPSGLFTIRHFSPWP